jgi:alcohol dehydrogenase (NADP+)/uncharacterized zinc-type alcohol dehydrogenase-like protein
VTGAGVALSGAALPRLFGEENSVSGQTQRIASKGYAARDASGKLSLWSFARRPVGDDDVLINIHFCGICHSDIHQLRGDWGVQRYPQVAGHEIAGVVTAVGRNVTRFKVGDHAGVGCMVDSCGTCESCKRGEEQHCDRDATLFTYGNPDKTSPTGITQGGYSNNIVVKERFVIRLPYSIRLQEAAPLLCAGITTYSPLMKAAIKKGDKIGVAGIGGLGHLATKLAVSRGADVYAFTTSPSKVQDIRRFGAKEVLVVDSLDALKPFRKSLDYMISTIPVGYDVAAYASLVKPYGDYVQVGMPAKGELMIRNFEMIRNRVRYSGSLIGGIPQTQEVIEFCAANRILPEVQVIKPSEVNETWDKVVNKEARYRYVIDLTSLQA